MKVSFAFFTALTMGYFDQVSANNRLRGTQRHEQQVMHGAYFECTVKLIHGMPLPGHADLPPAYACDVAEHGGRSYLLTGDTVESFFKGENVASGIVSISVPYSALGSDKNDGVHSTIDISQETSEKISLTYDRRRMLKRSGVRKILVLRISDDDSTFAERKIAQSATKMYWDVFGDENNLKKVYRNCSGGQLNIIPATGSGVDRGVITVAPPNNVCNNMSYIDVGNHALDIIKNLGIDRTNTMIVMPNCVNFGRGAAWGELNGSYTWFPSENASFPMTQVHEFGHNLGMGHSNGDNDDPYADGSCYMGNRVPWTDKGAKMCFNAAKMWHFGWLSKFHSNNKPEKWGLSKKLIGIAEAHNRGHLVSEEKSVIRVQSLNNDTPTNLFIMYNHKMGPNSGVVSHENKIIVTEQGTRMASDSFQKAALGSGEEYRQRNWGGNGNTLVIKNCGFQKGSWGKTKRLAAAHVIIYVEGKTYKTCPTQSIGKHNQSDQNQNQNDEFETGGCVDFPGFNDSYGKDYTCKWYGQFDYLCENYGSGPPNENGVNANEACCVCGGGNRSIAMEYEYEREPIHKK